MRITNAGNVGIGTATPNEKLTVSGVISIAEGTAPTHTTAFGKLWANSAAASPSLQAADARPYWTDDTGQSYNLTLDRFNTLAPGATVIIDTDPVLPVFNSVTLDQNTTFATAVGKLGNGRSASVRVVCDGTTRTLTFPAGWTWLGSIPASLAAGDTGYLSITAYGAADTDVIAAWSYENAPAVVAGSGVATQIAYFSGASTISSEIAVGSNAFTWNATDNRLGVGTSAPVSQLSVGASSEFQVSSTGDIVAIRGQTTTFPAANAAGALTNNGSGTLSWTAVAPASSSLTGNMLWVDAVNGNNATAVRGNDGLPFLTVEAALAAALSGDVVMVRPGTYNVAATLTLPTGVALRGYNRDTTTIQKLLVTADTTLLTMGESSSIQDLRIRLTSAEHHTLKGVLWPGTTTATAHADHCYIDVDNSTAGDAGTSNVYGVHVTATSTPARITSVASNDVIVNVTSAGLGNKRGILLDTSIAYFRNESCIYSAVRTGAAAGSYIGGEINVLGGILAMNSGGYEGTSADMSETAGSLEVLGVDLTNDNANGKGFLVTQASPRFTWGIIGVVPSPSTRYLYPGTANDSGVEIFTRLAAKGIVKSLIVRSRVAPGVGTDVYTLRKNGVNTALTVSLTGAAVSAQILTASVSFSSSDDLSVSVSSTGGAGADVVIVAEIY
jgi:hypothetical protein